MSSHPSQLLMYVTWTIILQYVSPALMAHGALLSQLWPQSRWCNGPIEISSQEIAKHQKRNECHPQNKPWNIDASDATYVSLSSSGKEADTCAWGDRSCYIFPSGWKCHNDQPTENRDSSLFASFLTDSDERVFKSRQLVTASFRSPKTFQV